MPGQARVPAPADWSSLQPERLRSVVRCAAALLVCLIGFGCTHDFAGFHFKEKLGPQASAGKNGAGPQDAAVGSGHTDAAHVMDAAHAAPHDAGEIVTMSDETALSGTTEPTAGNLAAGAAGTQLAAAGAGSGAALATAGAAAARAGAGGHGGMTGGVAGMDAGVTPTDLDADVDEDAQIAAELHQCKADWGVLTPKLPDCRGCACQRCASPVLDCLSRGPVRDRALCSDLLSCALAHGCHDWDCYCSGTQCYQNATAPGDGPCASEMQIAAGGGHEAVSAAHRANDPLHPLVRAVRANGCLTGTPRGSVGGAITAKCEAECGE